MLRPYSRTGTRPTSGGACMPYTPAERAALIERYAHAPTLLKRALAKVPPEALQWKPAAGRWSAHEIIVPCPGPAAHSDTRPAYPAPGPHGLTPGDDPARP